MAGRAKLRGLDRYLLRGEYLVAEIHRHRIVLLRPFLAVLASAALAVWIDLNVGGSGSSPVVRLVWFFALAVFLWALWCWLEWRNERFVVTDKRILLFRGFITKRVPMMPLTKVTDMTYERSILGRMLGYGTFVLESAGQDQALSRIDHVPNSDENYRKIIAEIFGVASDESAEDGEYVRPEEEDAAWETEHDVPDPTPLTGRPRAFADDETYGPHVLASTRRPTIYRSADRLRRRKQEIDDTGEIPPYDPDWRP